IISDSKCVGITLGKDRASGNNGLENADGYNEVIRRVLKRGDWTKENIGSHIIRNNTISNCGEAGICGSLGAIFCKISGNHIHSIHYNKPFFGFEVAAIKFHAPIDCVIERNRIHNSYRAIWLDWMTQGTRVSRNLVYNNRHDFFSEVNHGPYLVDNNLFLSQSGIDTWSDGGAYVHNLVAGRGHRTKVLTRSTPYHPAHSTEVIGIKNIEGGDERIYNNIFSRHPNQKHNHSLYLRVNLPLFADGNVYLNGPWHYEGEENFIEDKQFDPQIKCVEKDDGVYLHMTLPSMKELDTRMVTSKLLGKPLVTGLPYENIDGTPIKVDTDYFGKKRSLKNPAPGPFADPGEGEVVLKVW
ncbi:MAG: right-handed parallel beta-helix repeat-containing protein, partial [Verrucomicrobiota bacterium]